MVQVHCYDVSSVVLIPYNSLFLWCELPILMVWRTPFVHLLAVVERLCGGRHNILLRPPKYLTAAAKRTCGGRQKICGTVSSHYVFLHFRLISSTVVIIRINIIRCSLLYHQLIDSTSSVILFYIISSLCRFLFSPKSSIFPHFIWWCTRYCLTLPQET